MATKGRNDEKFSDYVPCHALLSDGICCQLFMIQNVTKDTIFVGQSNKFTIGTFSKNGPSQKFIPNESSLKKVVKALRVLTDVKNFPDQPSKIYMKKFLDDVELQKTLAEEQKKKLSALVESALSDIMTGYMNAIQSAAGDVLKSYHTPESECTLEISNIRHSVVGADAITDLIKSTYRVKTEHVVTNYSFSEGDGFVTELKISGSMTTQGAMYSWDHHLSVDIMKKKILEQQIKYALK
ncbi:hypothetical protein AKO1_006952 [Acrasis kona]